MDWKLFFIKLVTLMLFAPIMGWLLVRLLEQFEAAWKSQKRKKRWQACTLAFIGLAIAFGWFGYV